MRLPYPAATVIALALLAPSLAFAAEPPPSSSPATASPSGPSFQSGGLKATVTSLSGKGNNISISLLIENKTKENLLAAVIGPPVGVNGGNVFDANAIGGISYCIYNPSRMMSYNYHTLERSFEINGCLKGDKPQLTPDSFTLIEAGNAVPMNVAFTGEQAIDPDKDFSFSMNVAIFKESDANTPADSDALEDAKAKQKLPKSLRYISVGIPSLPLNRKNGL